MANFWVWVSYCTKNNGWHFLGQLLFLRITFVSNGHRVLQDGCPSCHRTSFLCQHINCETNSCHIDYFPVIHCHSNVMRLSARIQVNLGEPVTRLSSAIPHAPIHTANYPHGQSTSSTSLYLLHPLCIDQASSSPYWSPPSKLSLIYLYRLGHSVYRILDTTLCPVIVWFPLYMPKQSQPVTLQYCA